MGHLRPVYKAALIAGITSADEDVYARALEALIRLYGPVAIESPVFAFTITDYYTEEMGAGLSKRFIAFQRPIDMEMLSGIKLATNGIEIDTARHDTDGLHRRVNIDPGYVTLSKLVLATTKDYSHRIYIGQGIYAETTLRFFSGAFHPIDTTYPDHQTPLALAFFNDARDFLRRNRDEWNR